MFGALLMILAVGSTFVLVEADEKVYKTIYTYTCIVLVTTI